MRAISGLVAAMLFLASAGVLAQSPYVINGLHTGLTLREAVAQAEKLGGVCQFSAARSNETDKSVQCEYKHCLVSSGCEDAISTGPTFASCPIFSIGLSGPGDAAPLTQIVMVYKGETAAVAAGLIDAFGPTEANGAPTDEKTWTTARRWSWAQGRYRMGLMDSPQLIILTTDQVPASSDADS